MNEAYEEAGKALISGISYMMDEAQKINSQIYNGIIVSKSGNSYTIKINGNDYNIPLYGEFTHNVNDVVKVFVPQGNMNLAFFI